jgi:hypothetical protein
MVFTKQPSVRMTWCSQEHTECQYGIATESQARDEVVSQKGCYCYREKC